MPAWGASAAGFTVKPLANIVADMQQQVWDTIDPNLDLTVQTPDGQTLQIVANQAATNWELAQAAWNQFNREDAEGAALDNIGDLTGTPRETSTYTQIESVLTLDPAHAPYGAGSLVANVENESSQTYSNLYTITSSMISGGTVTTIMQSTVIGEVPFVNDGTLNEITTPVTGWTGVSNPGSGTQTQVQTGTNEELDQAYMIRQVEELAAEGTCNPSATAEALIALGAAQSPPVTITPVVVENTGDTWIVSQGVGIPPHSYVVTVYDGGTGWASSAAGQAAIAQALWQNKPAGIAPFPLAGSIAVTYTDPVLGPQQLYYSVATGAPLYMIMYVVPRSNVSSFANLQTAITNALAAAAVASTPANGDPLPGQLLPGELVVGSQLQAVVAGVPGVLDVYGTANTPGTPIRFGTSPSPTNTAPIQMAANQLATIVPANITILQASGL